MLIAMVVLIDLGIINVVDRAVVLARRIAVLAARLYL